MGNGQEGAGAAEQGQGRRGEIYKLLARQQCASIVLLTDRTSTPHPLHPIRGQPLPLRRRRRAALRLHLHLRLYPVVPQKPEATTTG
jgi:hypothetical protein